MGQYEYELGVSFTGEHRELVELVCKELVGLGFSKDKVFYDKWHQARITGPNADVLINNIYRKDCHAVIVFLSKNYKDKPWTGNIEWRSIRDLINRSLSNQICLLRLDGVDVDSIDGLSSTRDIAADVSKMTPKQVAVFIRDWYSYHVAIAQPRTTKLESEYETLIERTYDALADSRDTINRGDVIGCREAFSRVDAAMRGLYRFAERYSMADRLRSESCAAIVNQYNRFVSSYNELVDAGDRTSEESQQKTLEAQREFNQLIPLVLHFLNADIC